jgi:hypothetical protein
MADLAVGLAYRNARLRAWRAYGVPIEGGWRSAPRRRVVVASAELRCAVCGERDDTFLTRNEEPAKYLVMLARSEADSLRWIVAERRCSHLAPLLGEDPPEIIGLTQLELLAGDP